MSKANANCELRIANYIETAPLEEWPALPTETEIYILPDGEIVVADLPVDLMDLITQLHIDLPLESTSPPVTA